MEKYYSQKIEKKWQKYWEKKEIFKTEEISTKKNFYCLDMFIYPSGEGLHVGHLKGYTFSDVIAKKKKMEGLNVLHPFGWDAFGLPAENFAIKTGVHPAISTKKAIKNIKRQLISSGLGYDWQREICTCDSDYYKWTQWMFLQLYKKGLAYKKEAPVNFCPSCKTVLAREQVVNGKCERCDNLVEKKYLKQWFFKITDYVEDLLNDLDKIDWPEKIKTMQKNWIGKSEGSEIIFKVEKSQEFINLPVFTTRADTLFGCSYLVIAPEHSLIENLKSEIKNWKEVEKYIEKAKKKTEIERLSENKEKTGIELKEIKAINPINNQEVPIFVADYVLLEYGTGVIMAVPAHDQRDFLFSKKYNLPIIEVIKPKTGTILSFDKAFEEDGILINSGVFNSLASSEAREEIIKYLEKRNLGKKVTHYKLRDWLISRQRYWGTPIPIIYCSECGEQPVSEKELPVLLPKIKDFKPTGKGESPLAKVKNFIQAKCPKCGLLGKRETDTMDTFICSSWYFLRYIDSKNKKEPFNKLKVKNWLPVDLYIGGAEHAVMHLLYSRFFVKVLKKIEYLDFDEPFLKLFNQGTVYRLGAKMSKSKGNVISPDYIFKKFGADTMRLYELFMGPSDQATEWSDKGIIGCFRFLNKVWNLQDKIKVKISKNKRQNKDEALNENQKIKTENLDLEKLIHKTIKIVTEDIDNFRFNTAVSSLMILVNEMEKKKELLIKDYQLLIKLLAPIVPHISEELWQKVSILEENFSNSSKANKKSIFFEEWPKYDEKLSKKEMTVLIIQVNGKTRDKIENEVILSEEETKEIVLKREKIKKWVEGKKIKKIIFVPGKLINIVI